MKNLYDRSLANHPGDDLILTAEELRQDKQTELLQEGKQALKDNQVQNPDDPSDEDDDLDSANNPFNHDDDDFETNSNLESNYQANKK